MSEPRPPTGPPRSSRGEPSDAPAVLRGTRAERLASGRGRGALLATAAAAVVIAAVALLVLSRSHGGPRGGASPTAPTVAFSFPAPAARGQLLGGASADALARPIANGVAQTLGRFYELAFFDAAAWSGPPPAAAWAAFAPSAAGRARQDAAGLTLAGAGERIGTLRPASSSLAVRVLFDPKRRPIAVIATVSFVARGTLARGGSVEVTSRGSYLMEQVGGRWLIAGYPGVRTEVVAPAPAGA